MIRIVVTATVLLQVGAASRQPHDHRPACLRLLNLANEPARLSSRTKALTGNIQPGEASGFVSVADPQSLKIKCGATESSVDVKIPSGQTATVVLCVDGKKTGVILNDQAAPTAERNFAVGAIQSNGPSDHTWGPISVSNSGLTRRLTPKIPTAFLPLGTWKVEGPGVMSPPVLNLKKSHTYTLVLVRYGGGKYSANLLDSGPSAK
jgi:hypothetical protein